MFIFLRFSVFIFYFFLNHYCLAKTEIVFSKKLIDNLYSRDKSNFKHDLSRFIENIFLIKLIIEVLVF